MVSKNKLILVDILIFISVDMIQEPFHIEALFSLKADAHHRLLYFHRLLRKFILDIIPLLYCNVYDVINKEDMNIQKMKSKSDSGPAGSRTAAWRR